MRLAIELALTTKDGRFAFERCGVWVQSGEHVVIRYAPGFADREAWARDMLAGLREPPGPDFLDYWVESMGAYRGQLSGPVEIHGYRNADEAADAQLRRLIDEEPF